MSDIEREHVERWATDVEALAEAIRRTVRHGPSVHIGSRAYVTEAEVVLDYARFLTEKAEGLLAAAKEYNARCERETVN